MKQTIVIIIVLISLICNVQAQRVPGLNKDTLTWLKTHIENNSNYFNGKPFKLVLDSLYGIKNKLKSYHGPRPSGYKILDTLFTDSIIIYLGDEYEARYFRKHDSANHYNYDNNLVLGYYQDSIPMFDTLNTHLIGIKVFFLKPVPFLNIWLKNDRQGLGETMYWTLKLANYWGRFSIRKVVFFEL